MRKCVCLVLCKLKSAIQTLGLICLISLKLTNTFFSILLQKLFLIQGIRVFVTGFSQWARDTFCLFYFVIVNQE